MILDFFVLLSGLFHTVVFYIYFGLFCFVSLVCVQLISVLSSVESIHITSDAAALATGDSYVTVVGHWIDDHWEKVSKILALVVSNGMLLEQ